MNAPLPLKRVCRSSLTMRSLAAIFFAGVLCGCSALSPDPGAMAQQRSKQPPRNYRQIIVDWSVNFNIVDGSFNFSISANTATTDEIAKQRKLTAEQLNKEAQNTSRSLSTVGQVSALRETGGPQMGDWMACLRISKPSGMKYIAIFFEDEKILDYRTAVTIDRCEGETYGPLPPRSRSPNKEEQPIKKGSARFERAPSQH